jgi:hypothetical protein
MPETYDGEQVYLETEPSDQNYWRYPDSNNITIFGPVILPKIYGSNLSELEIASDGMISLTINTLRAFEIDQSAIETDLGLTESSNFQIKSMSSNIRIVGGGVDESVVIGSERIYKDATFQKHKTNATSGFMFENNLTLNNKSLSVGNNAFVQNNLSVGTDTSLKGQLSVGGIASFKNNVFITGPQMRIPVGVEGQRPSDAEDAGLIYYNTTLGRFEGLFSDHEDDPTKTWNTLGGVIDADQDTFILAESNNENQNTLYFHASNADLPLMTMQDSNLEFNTVLNAPGTKVIMNSTLSVAEAVAFDSTLSVNGESYFNSNLNVASNLVVEGDTALNSNLYVDGATALNTTLSVNGNTNLDSNLNVASNLVVDGATTLKTTLSVNGITYLNSNLNVEKKVVLSSTLSVFNATKLNDTLTVGGNTVLNSNLTVTEAVAFESTLSVNGESYFNSNLNVASNLVVEGDTALNSNLYVDGATALNTTLSVNGNTNLDSNLNVASNLVVDGATTLKTTLSVNGITYLNSNLNVEKKVVLSSTLSVFNATKLNDTLTVGGNTFLNSNLTVTSDTKLKSTLSVNSSAQFDNSLRMNQTTGSDGVGLLQFPRYNAYATYRDAYNDLTGDNAGSIVFDTDTQQFMGLTGETEDEAWRPLGGGAGLLDANGDTKITAESAFGENEDVLTFTASNVVIATMSNDVMEINEQLSVGKKAYFTDEVIARSNINVTKNLVVERSVKIGTTLSVNSDAVIMGGLSINNNSVFNGNVTLSVSQTLSSETVLTNRIGHYSLFNPGSEDPGSGDLDMFYKNVKLHGNLDVAGNINQINTTASDLYVEDKQIHLGVSQESHTENTSNDNGTFTTTYHSSNHNIFDSDNHDAGVFINGIPDSYSTSTEAERSNIYNTGKYEKSLTFNCPDNLYSMDNLAYFKNSDDSKQLEPYWKFKGGHLRIEGSVDDTVSFGFRVNSKQQLELTKIVGNVFQTIAKFGAIVSTPEPE